MYRCPDEDGGVGGGATWLVTENKSPGIRQRHESSTSCSTLEARGTMRSPHFQIIVGGVGLYEVQPRCFKRAGDPPGGLRRLSEGLPTSTKGCEGEGAGLRPGNHATYLTISAEPEPAVAADRRVGVAQADQDGGPPVRPQPEQHDPRGPGRVYGRRGGGLYSTGLRSSGGKGAEASAYTGHGGGGRRRRAGRWSRSAGGRRRSM